MDSCLGSDARTRGSFTRGKRPGSGGLSNVVGLPNGTSSRPGAYFHVGECPREKAGGSSFELSKRALMRNCSPYKLQQIATRNCT